MFGWFGLYLLRNALIDAFQNHRNEVPGLTDSIETDSNESSTGGRQNDEQIPHRIREFSSQYGSNRSDSYVVANICSHPEIYPAYGDSTHALVFRTYGPWWMAMPSFRETTKHFERSEHQFTSRDFIEIEYSDNVCNCVSLNIYETYNPGTVEVVYAGRVDEQGNIDWHRVWSFPEPFSVILSDQNEVFIENGQQSYTDLFPDGIEPIVPTYFNAEIEHLRKILTKHSFPAAARVPRIVRIPLENRVPFETRFFRVEFDHSSVRYYSEIDTIILCGQTVKEISVEATVSVVQRKISTNSSKFDEDQDENLSRLSIVELPFDILSLICSYLDLRSLVRLSATCRLLHAECLHSSQFRSINLQPYWNGLSNFAIEQFFVRNCNQTQHLSLAWSRSIQYSSFSQLLNSTSTHLLQLNLSSCQYLTFNHISAIVEHCPKLEILSLDNCLSLNNFDFVPLKNLNCLRSLNVYRTKIDYRTLLPLIESNRETLEHLNLGACEKLIDTVGIVKLLFSRCYNLRSIDLWRAHGLTNNGFFSLAGLPFDIGEEKRRFLRLSNEEQDELSNIYSSVNMPMVIQTISSLKYLSEVDLGWTDPPPGFIETFTKHIGQSLIKLFLTACRRVTNEDILSLSKHSPKIRQLDLLGSSIISETTISCVLQRCLSLEFLDLSFCDKISDETVCKWMEQHRITFKRSYPPLRTNDVTIEFP